MLEPYGSKYRLTKDYEYKDVVVPRGFVTDGVTYKLRLVALVIDRFSPEYIEAVIVHDYLCELEMYEKADQYFEELLPKGWKSKLMVLAVKIYHDIMYKV